MNSAKKPARGGLRLGIWLAIPLAILAAGELVAHRLVHRSILNRTWYRGALTTAASQNLDFIFVGTSRTMTGIDTQAWGREIEEARGERVVSFNLGRAYAGPVAHHFGLRELVERYPERMQGCTVFFEFCAGLPEYTRDWRDPWYYPGNAQLVVDYMEWSDLRRFLALPNSFDAEVGLVARYLGRPFNLVAGRRQIQQAVEYRGQRALGRLLSRIEAADRTPDRTPDVDSALPQNRGLRTDPQGVAQLREIIRSRMDPEVLAKQESWTPWESRVVCQTAEYLLEHGVQVAFHEVLVPSYVRAVNETVTRRADQQAFREWAGEHGVRIIESGLPVVDSDFPDLSHLQRGQVEAYTQSLARAFLRGSDPSAPDYLRP